MSIDILDAGAGRHGEIVRDELLAASAERRVIGGEIDEIRRMDDSRINAIRAPLRREYGPRRRIVLADFERARIAREYLDAFASCRGRLGYRAGEFSTDAHVDAE